MRFGSSGLDQPRQRVGDTPAFGDVQLRWCEQFGVADHARGHHASSALCCAPCTTAPPHAELGKWEPLESLHSALLDDNAAGALAKSEREWLLDRIAEIRGEIADLEWALEPGLIHGDAWAGNLLWDSTIDPNRAIFGDWDWVCIGPREVDLIPTWHASIRYGRDHRWVENFIAAYGFDLATWPGYATLMDMRDLVQVSGPLRRASTSTAHEARLRQRVTDIHAGNRTTSWTSY